MRKEEEEEVINGGYLNVLYIHGYKGCISLATKKKSRNYIGIYRIHEKYPSIRGPIESPIERKEE